jgi:hypothetical protein
MSLWRENLKFRATKNSLNGRMLFHAESHADPTRNEVTVFTPPDLSQIQSPLTHGLGEPTRYASLFGRCWDGIWSGGPVGCPGAAVGLSRLAARPLRGYVRRVDLFTEHAGAAFF